MSEAASFGFFEDFKGEKYPIIQVIRVEDLLNHKKHLWDYIPK